MFHNAALRLALVLTLGLYPLATQASPKDDGNKDSSNRWQEEWPATLRIKGGITAPSLDFALVGPGSDATFVPNSSAVPFLAVSYHGLTLTGQMPSGPDEKTIQSKGNSSISDYQLRWFGHRSTAELIYQRFQGFQLQGWQDGSGNQVLRSDIGMQYVGFNFIRALSPRKFSLAVAFDQNGVQFRNGGSLFVWSSVGQTRIWASDPLIPNAVQLGASEISTMNAYRLYSAQIGLGYGHQLPITRALYANFALFSGGGLGEQRVFFIDRSEWQTTYIYRIGIRLGLGYSYGNHLAGARVIVDSNEARVSDGKIQQATINTQIFYGYRFQGYEIPWLDRLLF